MTIARPVFSDYQSEHGTVALEFQGALLVEHWQFYLRGVGLHFGEVNGNFDQETKLATEEFQRRHGLKDDGTAGHAQFHRLVAPRVAGHDDTCDGHVRVPVATQEN